MRFTYCYLCYLSGGGGLGGARPKEEAGAGATATVGAGPTPAGVMALPGQYYLPVSLFVLSFCLVFLDISSYVYAFK